MERKPMEIIRNGSQPSGTGPAEYFTGKVRIAPLFNPPEPTALPWRRLLLNPAHARPGIRPLGQTLIVTAGFGWVQREGEAVQEIRQGDVVCFAPGEGTGTVQLQPQP